MEIPRRTLILQILLVSLIVLGIVILAIIFIPRTIPPGQHRITLRIEATAGSATIQYDAGSHVQKDPDLIFNTPWEKSWILKSGTQVLLTAGNHQETGTIKCIIRSDGVTWKYSDCKNTRG